MSDNKRKLILTRGIQGSGKTYFAKSWVEEDPEHRIRINNDDIRNMLGPYWIPSRETLVSSTKKEIAHAAMRSNYDIVVDNMNLNPKEINTGKILLIVIINILTVKESNLIGYNMNMR